MRDLLVAVAVLAGIAIFLRIAVWPFARRIDRKAEITTMAWLMNKVERQHRDRKKRDA